MKPFHILITSISLFSLASSYANPTTSSPAPFSSDYEETDTIDEELSLLNEEIDAFEQEAVALEEEWQQDSEPLQEPVAILEENTQAKEDVFEETLGFSPAEEEELTFSEDSFVEAPKAAAFETLTEENTTQDNLAITSQEHPSASLERAEPSSELASYPLKQDLETKLTEEHQSEDIQLTSAHSVTVDEPMTIAGEPATEPVKTVKPRLQKNEVIEVNLQQAFSGSPYIYTLLGCMSVAAVGIWFYSLLSIRSYGKVPESFLKNLQNKLNSNQFEDALSLCSEKEHVFSKMIASGIQTRRHGLPIMVEAMKTEGKRTSVHFWQRIGLLNDIAILAPMLGLLGTVLGMFYAFYDINRSIESISTLFDGLGISVGTTVAGLVVAILALILHSTAKYRLVKTLAQVENEAQTFATLIDDRTSVYKG